MKNNTVWTPLTFIVKKRKETFLNDLLLCSPERIKESQTVLKTK